MSICQGVPSVGRSTSKGHFGIVASIKKMVIAGMSKVGRNDPCPCGSGKKFKKCCIDSTPMSWPSNPPIPPEVLKKFMEHETEERARIARYGHVKPEISIDFQGYKFVAVGSRLHYSKTWKFFPEFLMHYLPTVFGKEWGQAELSKPFDKQHQVVQWRTKAIQYMQKQKKNEQGFYDAVPSGFQAAFLNLAYDLYIVEHNGRLDDDLLNRLKHRDQFQGARHELFAEATCLRAGFTIDHEDEKDGSKRHAEFIATHKDTGQKISVEAKSKHRDGILGRPGSPEPENEANLRFGKLINDAIDKNPAYPLVIFLDTNLPPAIAEQIFAPVSMEPFIPPRPMKFLDEVRKKYGGRDPYVMILFTNHPHYYGKEDEQAPTGKTLFVMSQVPTKPLTHPNAILALYQAANLYSNIPNTFPDKG